ncbi:MAG: UDP-N-acetylglucosamine 2-epimerase [Candidatus Peribacteraceae bacterium]|jgi:UDP-N-acetylglucosamine 2-epimerase (non-hydrolysing)
MQEVSFRSPSFFDDIGSRKEKRVHLVMIATKPDIIKQVPLYRKLRERGHLVLLGHTGQHYSDNLSGGMLKEFGVEPDFNLNVRGSMYEVVSQIIGRLGWVMEELKKRGKTVVPYVHGDTTTAMAASNAGYCHGFASVHVEAGIRTLSPAYQKWFSVQEESEKGLRTPLRPAERGYEGQAPDLGRRRWEFSDIQGWRQFLMERKNWERGSLEPYPEQFNTRCSEAGTGIHLAPVELDREFLIGEGFPEDRIAVVGNSVADATLEAVERAKGSEIFNKYPRLKEGNFVRFCIHRRENCASDRRFLAIYGAMKSLIEEGRGVLLISLFQTESALLRLDLKAEVEALAEKHANFIYSPVWPQYGDVIAAMMKASVCATDSGSMQEEMNILGVPCVTLRFGSDRSESAMGGGNLIAPPVDSVGIKRIIEYAWDNEEMRKAPKLYGENVSKRCIDVVDKILKKEEVFRDEEGRLGVNAKWEM